MPYTAQIEDAKKKFEAVLEEQLKRVEKMKAENEFIDYDKLDQIIIGVVGGDGIGPAITEQAERILKFLLKDEVDAGKVAFKEINGCTIEHRAEVGKALPDDVIDELKQCHVILKGPTTTPRQGDPWPNIESANLTCSRT